MNNIDYLRQELKQRQAQGKDTTVAESLLNRLEEEMEKLLEQPVKKPTSTQLSLFPENS